MKRELLACRVIQKGRIVQSSRCSGLRRLNRHRRNVCRRNNWVNRRRSRRPKGRSGKARLYRRHPGVANHIREFVPACFTVLGTDGVRRSDTRANLRRHFGVDRFHIAHAAIAALAAEGT